MRSEVHRVVLALTNQMPIFEAAVPCEVFGIDRSDLVSPWYHFSIVAVGDDPVTLGSQFRLTPTGDEREQRLALAAADTLIVPACADVHDNPSPALVDVVRAAYERGTRILSICSGAFVLAAAGVLDGRRATTHWMHAEELRRRYPAVQLDPAVLYVEDRNVITSAGTAAGIDACLHLVRRDHGAGITAELARRLVTPPHRDGGQTQYHRFVSPPVAEDWLAGLLEWIEEELHSPLATTQLAAHANVSPRTLERRFATVLGMSPLQWLLQQRVRRAQQLLETTDLPIDWIATGCGFGSTSSLRAHFSRLVAVSPSAYRRTFHDPAHIAEVAP